MKTQSTFNPYAQACRDLRGIEAEARGINVRWNARKLCWKCQCEKPSKGGSLRLLGGPGGLMRFICADCRQPSES